MGTGDDVVIIGHPATFTRYGYSLDHEGAFGSGYDRDVEFLPTARHLVEAGYSVLMYDQRNHGESGASPNGAPHDPTQAYWDTVAAVTYVSQHPELADKDIGLLSFCQSSFVSMVAMSEEPDVLRDASVKAMVAVQPIAMDLALRNFGMPAFVVERVSRISVRAGATAYEDQNPELYAGDVLVPVLFVQALGDPWSDIDHSRAIYDAIPTEKEAIWIEGDLHRFDTYNWFNDHPEELLSFFEQNLGEN
jgi:pimeloyl-ACP methyl ester carboxylesterase